MNDPHVFAAVALVLVGLLTLVNLGVAADKAQDRRAGKEPK